MASNGILNLRLHKEWLCCISYCNFPSSKGFHLLICFCFGPTSDFNLREYSNHISVNTDMPFPQNTYLHFRRIGILSDFHSLVGSHRRWNFEGAKGNLAQSFNSLSPHSRSRFSGVAPECNFSIVIGPLASSFRASLNLIGQDVLTSCLRQAPMTVNG